MYYPSFARVAAVEETEPFASEHPASVKIAIVDPVTERIPGSKSLHRYLYRFSMFDTVIVLDTVRLETRHTTRHSWQAVGTWSRLDHRAFPKIDRRDVPPYMAKLVLEAFTSQIRFETADEKRGNQR